MYRVLVSVTIAAAVAVHALKRKKLTPRASATAFCVGTLIGCSGTAPLVSLLSFFLSASRATKVGKQQKERILDKYEESGNRNVSQVLCNSGAALALIVVDAWLRSNNNNNSSSNTTTLIQSLFTEPCSQAARFAIVMHFAATNGDTFSSELGVLSKTQPRHILAPWRRVPTGTNGGVSLLGFGGAALGGLIVGLTAELAERFLAPNVERSSSSGLNDRIGFLTLSAILAGLGGSIVDSILGSTLQYSGTKVRTDGNAVVAEEIHAGEKLEHITGVNVLSNDGVNLVSAAVTTAVAYWVAKRFGL